MNIINNEKIIAFDIDETLVMHGLGKNSIECPYDGSIIYLTPHARHVKLLKDHKARGYSVIVWSAAGFRWASKVIKMLELDEYVDLILTKPIKYVDDLPVDEWMQNRIYLNR